MERAPTWTMKNSRLGAVTEFSGTQVIPDSNGPSRGRKRISCSQFWRFGFGRKSVAVLMTDLSIRRFQASVVNVNHFVGDLVPSWTVQQIFFWTENWAI